MRVTVALLFERFAQLLSEAGGELGRQVTDRRVVFGEHRQELVARNGHRRAVVPTFGAMARDDLERAGFWDVELELGDVLRAARLTARSVFGDIDFVDL